MCTVCTVGIVGIVGKEGKADGADAVAEAGAVDEGEYVGLMLIRLRRERRTAHPRASSTVDSGASQRPVEPVEVIGMTCPHPEILADRRGIVTNAVVASRSQSPAICSLQFAGPVGKRMQRHAKRPDEELKSLRVQGLSHRRRIDSGLGVRRPRAVDFARSRSRPSVHPIRARESFRASRPRS